MSVTNQHGRDGSGNNREARETAHYFNPRGGRLILWGIVLFVFSFLAWTSVSKIDEVTRGEGKVVPSRQVQILQSLEGGIISEIAVHEGDVVNKDQLLVKLDEAQLAAALREGETHCMEHRAKVARLEAEAERKEFVPPKIVLDDYPQFVQQEYDLYKARKKQFERQERSLEKELGMMRPLEKQGAVSEIEILRLERKLDELRDDYCTGARKELNDLLAEISRLAETNQAIRNKLERTKITSPVKGVVKRIMVNTIGGVVRPGEDLIEIVPLEDTLLIEARISPADIAFIHPGQEVLVKFTAYDFAIYGGLQGRIENISADVIEDDKSESYYKIMVKTDKNQLGSGKEPLPVIPGMSVRLDIITGKKTILAYLLKPVLRAKEKALRER
ncbi:MAG: HlyD family type I secretion periplasmic adaptor subunit [Gammaproteobacteria bacterium]|nr:HlyD family type I secretion periplasmic adaptor subunit [Gammaproteobacteria bacterium]